jgi:hypothetical protein
MSEFFDPHYTWLGVPPEEQPADHYRLLGIRRYESNVEVILNASDQRMAFLRTVQHGTRMKVSQELLNEISAVRTCLLDPSRKAAYDAELRNRLAPQAGDSVREDDAVAATPWTIDGGPAVTGSTAIPPNMISRAVHRRSLATASVPRRKQFLAIEIIKIVAGGAAGLILGAVLLRYVFQIDVLSSLSSPRPSGKYLVGQKSSTPESASRTEKTGSISGPAAPKLADSSDAAASSSAVGTKSVTTRPSASSAPVDGAQPRPATAASSVEKSTAATAPERDAKLPAPSTAVTAPSTASRQAAPATTAADSLPATIPLPPASMLPEIRTAQEAIAELRKAGLQIGDTPDAVQTITTQGTSFGPEHAPLFGLFPDILYITLSNTPAAPAILEKLPLLPTVHSLQFENTPITDENLVHLRKFPGLFHLSLHGTKVKGPGLVHLRHLTLLNNLQLLHELSRNAVPLICQARTLQHVGPWPRGLTDGDFREIAKLTQLRFFAIPDSTIDVSGLAHLKDLKELESIGWASEPPYGMTAALSKFNFTRYSFPNSCSDAEVAQFRLMPRLAYVSAPQALSDMGLETLAAFPALQQLSLEACTQISDAGLIPLAESKTLESISLPRQISDDGARHISSIATLRSVSFAYESRVTDCGIAELVRLPFLKSLVLGPGLTDLSANHLVQMQALERLELRATRFTAKAFHELKQLPTLKSLNLSMVPIDDDTISALQGLRLQSLVIQHNKFPPERLAAIRRALPRAYVMD